MNKIYDNGYYLLGKVEDILNYADADSLSDDLVVEMLEELKDYDKESIVCINYDNPMGCTIQAFGKQDIIWESE